jgi:hypothetical protein
VSSKCKVIGDDDIPTEMSSKCKVIGDDVVPTE